MITKTISQEVEFEVNLDLADFDDDELIGEIEDRGFFLLDQDDSGAMSDAAKDDIYNLYRDFIRWDKNEMPDNGFVLSLKKFFEENLNILVA